MTMARAIWSGSISFGLLNVPVKLYSAVARRGISLREIRESDGARIRHRRVAEGTEEEVPYEKIVKAFEIAKDRYIPLAKAEMEALAPEKSRAIEVQDFVDLDEIDPIYFDSPYYLGPADGAERAYSLLARAMEQSGEVVPPAELEDVLPAEAPKVPKREVEMAEQLIESLTRRFDPAAYRDEYREQLLAMIERKAAGEEVLTAPESEEPEATKAPDLMAALEQSIAAVQGERDGGAAKKPSPRKKRAAPKKAPAKKRSGSRAKAKSSK
jgi:DNA end-binding protein Ku